MGGIALQWSFTLKHFINAVTEQQNELSQGFLLITPTALTIGIFTMRFLINNYQEYGYSE